MSAVLFFSWSPAFCIDVWLNQYAIWRFNWSHTATFPSAKLNDLGVVHTIWCYGDPAHQFFSQTRTRVECIDSHVSKGETVSANWIHMPAALFRFFAYFLTIQLYKHGMLSQDLKSETLQLFQIMSRKALYSRQEIWNFKHNYYLQILWSSICSVPTSLSCDLSVSRYSRHLVTCLATSTFFLNVICPWKCVFKDSSASLTTRVL